MRRFTMALAVLTGIVVAVLANSALAAEYTVISAGGTNWNVISTVWQGSVYVPTGVGDPTADVLFKAPAGGGSLVQQQSGSFLWPTGCDFHNFTYDPTCGAITFQYQATKDGALDLFGDIINNSPNLQTINISFALQATGSPHIINAASGNVTIGPSVNNGSGTLSGAGGLTKAGNYMLTLSGTNTYGGDTTVTAGTLQAKQAASLPNYASQTIAVNGTSTLALNAGAASGEWTSTEIDGLLANTSVTFAAGTRLGIDTTGGHFAYGFDIAKANTGLTKMGANTLTLSGTNSYAGGTTVSAGTLTYLNTAAKPASGITTVASGAALGVGVGAGPTYFIESQVTNVAWLSPERQLCGVEIAR